MKCNKYADHIHVILLIAFQTLIVSIFFSSFRPINNFLTCQIILPGKEKTGLNNGGHG